MSHIQALVSREGNTPFCVGWLVTGIVRALNLNERLENLPSLPPLFMDINNCRAGRLIKVRQDGRYNLMVRNREVRSVILPNSEITRIDRRDNWIYDLDAPALSENLKDNQNDEDNVDEVEQEMDQGEPQPDETPNPILKMLLDHLDMNLKEGINQSHWITCIER
ncbi:uncharacterized protein LOC131604633 [Vicia villosa]|uniref:uncharacterized protein LOC131604633 n=1 Tax=Vicia villosa TaxID=3911 RepID=UPI00273C8B73|nr:uncharacterized protein LOC131604633 [Vicia villosa]